MSIRIVPVTDKNKGAVLKLRVAENQKNYIETVSACLEEAGALSLWRPVGVYDGNLLVGFAMYGEFREEGRCGRVWLDRLMIDEKYQNHGYGTQALRALVERLFAEYGCDEIYLSLYVENVRAEDIYERYGFLFNGERDLNGEKVMVLPKERWEKYGRG